MNDVDRKAAKNACVAPMAKALANAERALELAVIKLGALPAAVKEFHYGVGTHVSYMGETFSWIGQAQKLAADSLGAVGEAHKLLDSLRKGHDLDPPDVVTLNGGGGCKPNC